MIENWFVELDEALRLVPLGIAIGIFLLFLFIRKMFVRYMFSFLVKRLHRSSTAVKAIEAFQKPLQAILLMLGVYLAIVYYAQENWLILSALHRLFRSGIVIAVGVGFYNMSASSSTLLESVSKKFGVDEASMLIPFLSKAVRFVIIILVATVVISEWGFSINGVVAGMGLGSLAIALAAKDTLGNILGGIIIIIEKPFSKGDWILTPSVEGVVEDITFRSSQIRTFADAIVTVPNSTLADQPITNWSRMGKRRITFSLNVAIDTEANKLRTAIDRIEQYLTEDPSVDPGTIMVRFNEIKEGSLGIFLYYFSKTVAWKEHLTVRQDTTLAMMRILEEEGIKLAYPVQRVLLENNLTSEKSVARQ
ncbi:mechanosensitive ion channel family protein [Paenibacillus sp. GSMTC-2017]|uniref:mechanosensitive ion channel family protein n=1 Tax=Paenibacillus sp. GSMTC-2017 TaxID=2794350 RepID=UPI0018D6ADD2|nr:mechanosensitive ion channel family protein [Paenibacillus sp. GSMTC-2017]MBH5320557.1 mechanosensitive ion channel family protein [Paenibacillus sp. GSMTC-2017]